MEAEQFKRGHYSECSKKTVSLGGIKLFDAKLIYYLQPLAVQNCVCVCVQAFTRA